MRMAQIFPTLGRIDNRRIALWRLSRPVIVLSYAAAAAGVELIWNSMEASGMMLPPFAAALLVAGAIAIGIGALYAKPSPASGVSAHRILNRMFQGVAGCAICYGLFYLVIGLFHLPALAGANGALGAAGAVSAGLSAATLMRVLTTPVRIVLAALPYICLAGVCAGMLTTLGRRHALNA